MKPSFVCRMAFPAVCLLAVAVVTGLLAFWSAARQLALLDGFCTALVARAPETADAVYALVKDRAFAGRAAPGVLAELGYRPRDFAAGTGWLFAVAGATLALGFALLGGAFFPFPPGRPPAAAAADPPAGGRPHRPASAAAHRGRDGRGQLRPSGR